MVSPQRWDTWRLASVAFNRLFFLQELRVVVEEDWKVKVSAWSRHRPLPVVWGGRLKWLWGHARCLAMVLREQAESELIEELRAQRRPEVCRRLAHQWLA